MKKFLKVFFYCVGFSSLFILVQLVTYFIVMVGYIILFKTPVLLSGPNAMNSLDMMEIANVTLLPAMLIAAFLTFGVAWLIHLIFRKPFIERLSFQKTSLVFILLSLLAGISLQLPVGFMIVQAESTGIAPDLFREYAELMEPLMANQNLILQILAIGIFGPVLEECIFRGLVYHQLRKHMPAVLALILQALLFGISHMNIIQGSYAFLTGLLMGLLLHWSGSLLLPIMMHVGMNVTGVFYSYYGEGLNDTAYYILVGVSAVLIVVCMILMGVMAKNRPQEQPAP